MTDTVQPRPETRPVSLLSRRRERYAASGYFRRLSSRGAGLAAEVFANPIGRSQNAVDHRLEQKSIRTLKRSSNSVRR